MAHGRDANRTRAVEIALAAQNASIGLDEDRSDIYVDLILNSLGEAAREALMKMATQKYEYQSDFARHYFARGEVCGRATLVIRQLTARFGELGSELCDRIQRTPVAGLDAIGERLLTARTLQEALAGLDAS
jgi:hypothetical protein